MAGPMRYRVGPRIIPWAAGLGGALFLVGLYLGIVTWAQGLGHARGLIWEDRYFVGAIALGFGLQIGLYAHLRLLWRRRRLAAPAAVTAAGTGTSSVAMVACCAHHVADVLPVVGLSGVAIFLNDYRIPFMALGLAVNAAGVAIMLRLLLQERRRHALLPPVIAERSVSR